MNEQEDNQGEGEGEDGEGEGSQDVAQVYGPDNKPLDDDNRKQSKKENKDDGFSLKTLLQMTDVSLS